MKINNFRGELTDISAIKEALMPASDAALADVSVEPPRILFIFILRKYMFFGLKYPKNILFNSENKSTDDSARAGAADFPRCG